MGAPGLAFETWDPSNQFLLETPTPSLSSRAKPRDLRFLTPNQIQNEYGFPLYLLQIIYLDSSPASNHTTVRRHTP
jgi:hypothetical protein